MCNQNDPLCLLKQYVGTELLVSVVSKCFQILMIIMKINEKPKMIATKIEKVSWKIFIEWVMCLWLRAKTQTKPIYMHAHAHTLNVFDLNTQCKWNFVRLFKIKLKGGYCHVTELHNLTMSLKSFWKQWPPTLKLNYSKMHKYINV